MSTEYVTSANYLWYTIKLQWVDEAATAIYIGTTFGINCEIIEASVNDWDMNTIDPQSKLFIDELKEELQK